MTQQNDIVIRAQGLGKKYTLGAKKREGGYVALRDVAASAAQSLWRKRGALLARGPRDETPDPGDFWALRDVNFEIRRGEVVGIIGRNGAGKSTLLKILSRITEPTHGRVEIRGRVASLLEVGTGFHPELTGRENIALNGAILGMTQAEIRRKFDEIVAFAEVEKFLDTPVKRYSSGMYVRLAFAVAAHLEPEILIVDEVLAVGDAEFQKKCLGKMQDVAGNGRTVLFVSHQLSTIRNLTRRCILLDHGLVTLIGDTPRVLEIYQQASACEISVGQISLSGLHIDRILINGSSSQVQSIPPNGAISLVVEGVLSHMQRIAVEMNLRTLDGVPVGSFMPEHFRTSNIARPDGSFRIEAQIQLPRFLTGELGLSLSFTEPYVRTYFEIDPLVILRTDSPPVMSPGGEILMSSGLGPTLIEGYYHWKAE